MIVQVPRGIVGQECPTHTVRFPPTGQCSSVTDKTPPFSGKLPYMTSQTLASTLEGFLSGSNNAVVIEDGAVVFDLGKRSIRCRERATSVCCTCGRQSGMSSGACWMWNARARRCG